MNGSLSSSSNVVDIKLKRRTTGLGFNIIGGEDQQYVVNDNGIYVAKIKEDGAAALDGRLEEGDKILAINGVELTNVKHQHAVDLFRSAGEDVELRVLKKPVLHLNGPTSPQPPQESSGSLLKFLALLAGAAAVGAFIYMKRHRMHF